jgi:tRNA dimethylallyltransferase
VTKFFEFYKEAKQYAITNNKNLIIVGGSGFYLKAMLDGLSGVSGISGFENNTKLSKEDNLWIEDMLTNLNQAYAFVKQLDKEYIQNIEQNDRYRLEKALQIYKLSGQSPTEYFRQNPPVPLIDKDDISLYEISIDTQILRQKIALRTQNMLKDGLIDEVLYLEKKYSRAPNPMKSIGIKETLDYLDGKLTKEELIDKIIINTANLAKRQRTFNKKFNAKRITNIDEIR